MSPAQNMHMQMRHGFAGIGTIINYQAVARFFESELLGHLRGFQEQMAEHLVIFRLRFGNAWNDFSRNDQDMSGCPGLDVAERKNLVILINNFPWNFPGPDAFKQCLRHAVILPRSASAHNQCRSLASYGLIKR